MQSELKSLSKIFSETIFRIPDYQRGYSWETKHLKDFWNDLIQLPLGKSHYTGVLTLEPVLADDYTKWIDDVWIIKSKQYQPLYVVDGQQRLTTAVVLLQSILQCMGEEDVINYTTKAEIKKKYIFESKDKGILRSYIFGYETDNPSHEFLKQSIYEEQSELHSLPESTIYTANLASAKVFFMEKLKPLVLKEIEEIYTKLTQNLQFNIFYIEPDLDVFVTFETMNNRGKALSQLELLKNRLIYLTTKFEEDKVEQDRLRRKINESWKSIYSHLGRKPAKALDDDTFLKTHFLAYFGPELPKVDEDDATDSDYDLYRYLHREDLHRDFLFEKTFTVRRLYEKNGDTPLTVAELDNYAHDIRKSVEIYYHIINPEDGPFAEEEKTVLQRLRRSRGYDARLLSFVVMQVIKEPERRLAIFDAVERFSFLAQMKPYAFRSIQLIQLAIKLKAVELTPEEITRRLEGACKTFADSNEFVEALRNIGKSDGYYGWASLRYFMFEYEQMLRRKSKTARQILSWETFQSESFDSDHKSIEHIYPQKANDPYWKDNFVKYTVPERNILRNSLGNLLPVSLPKNSSLSNKAFLLKKGSVENQVGYSYGCLSEIQVAQQVDWDAVLIAARGIHLISFMESRWGFSLGSDEKKLEILGLSFVLNREGLDVERLKARYVVSEPLSQIETA